MEGREREPERKDVGRTFLLFLIAMASNLLAMVMASNLVANFITINYTCFLFLEMAWKKCSSCAV